MNKQEGDPDRLGNIADQLRQHYKDVLTYISGVWGSAAIQPGDPNNVEAISKPEYLSGVDWVLVDDVTELVRGIPQIPAMYCGQRFLAQRFDVTSTMLRQDNPEEIFIAINTQGQHVYSKQLVKPFIERLTQRAAVVNQKVQEWVTTHRDEMDSPAAVNHFYLIPLLDAEDEVDLAIIIEIGREAAEKIKVLDIRDPHSHEESVRLRQEIIDGKAAYDHFVMANVRLVESIAKRYIGRGVGFSDLIQEGNMGSMEALDMFDYRRGNKFSTYATPRIRQKISRAVDENSSTILVPVYTRNLIRQIQRFTYSFEQKFGRRPSIGEIARGLKKETKQIKAAFAAQTMSSTQSLDAPLGDETDTEFGELIASPDALPEDEAFRQILNDDFSKALEKLPENLAEVLRWCFGFKDGRNHTLEEIGGRLGITRERVSQLEYQALKMLWRNPNIKKLKDFLS